MSSKRRQEAIAQFSVPIDDDASLIVTNDDESPENEDAHHALSTQSKKQSSHKTKGKGKAPVNPLVMLLSLKAVGRPSLLLQTISMASKILQGAVGLNLTGRDLLHSDFPKLY